MALTYDDWIDNFYDDWNFSRIYASSMGDDYTAAAIYYAEGNDHLALGSVINAISKTASFSARLFNSYTYPFPRYNVIKLFTLTSARLDALEEGAGVEVDMDSILSAMVKATPYELQYFIGLVDAYRQSLWNKSFNAEFFAALARGFESWG